jgi:20S proteasome alpha/beta subunit
MTTIVYRDGVMAGDGRETIQNDEYSSYYILRDDCEKVWKLKDGSLFGAAHGSEDIERLRRALVKGRKPPKCEDVVGMRVDKKGRIWIYEGRIWQRIDQTYYAVGSGSIMAFPLLDAGVDAIKACTVAASRDPFSGGKVHWVEL